MKRFLAAMTATSLVVSLAASMAVAKAPSSTDLMGQQWRVYNRVFTPSLWDINKAQAADAGLSFPVQQFATTTSGSFAVYLLNNYNVSLTGTTLSSSVSWTPGTYLTRGNAADGAFVRFEFQDTTAGPYDSNDYWWSYVNLDLNALTSGTLTASLADRTLWYNQSGKPATDTETNWVEWQGDVVAMSPYDGFTKAMKNVKQLGLSFGNASSSASGIALTSGPGTFTMSSFTVTP